MSDDKQTTVRQFCDTVWNRGDTDAIGRFIRDEYDGLGLMRQLGRLEPTT
jgi:hypothetical protein